VLKGINDVQSRSRVGMSADLPTIKQMSGTTSTPTIMTPALTAAKRALRSTTKKSLSQLPAPLVQSQSQVCVKTLLSLPEYTAASRISVFLSMPQKEIDTSAIVEQSLNHGGAQKAIVNFACKRTAE